ncbi:ATP synthase F0 subunit A [bacterium]|nr:MAG: ATP synthase F0 subunit A [bacterium]
MKISLLILFALLFISGFGIASEPGDGEEKKHDDDGKLDIIEKVVDHDYVDFYFLGKLPLPKLPILTIGGVKINFSVTKSLFMMVLSSLLLIVMLKRAAMVNTKNRVPKGIGNFVETIVMFIRDDIVVPNMGKEGLKLLPFFLTLFFFILFANLIGIIPFLAQPTKNLSVTTGLALITFSTTQIMGMKKNGVLGYVKGLVPDGIPAFVLPIMIVVEFIGLFTKPFALLMRLFANITAGSIIILSLIGLIFIMNWAGAVIAVPFALFINLLEIFIALLQAYVFTMLSVLFINMAMHQH